VSMFKNSKEGDWIRPPVASYLLTAAEVPGEVGEQATAALAELEALDPETVKGARTSAAFGFLARAAASTTPASTDATAGATADSGDSESTAQADPPVPGVPVDAAADAAEPDGEVASEAEPAQPAETTIEPKPDGETEAVAAAAPAVPAAPSPPLAAPAPTPPSRIKMIGIPLVAAGVLLAVFAVLLRGADPRSSDENP
jgi:hypothetical protein